MLRMSRPVLTVLYMYSVTTVCVSEATGQIIVQFCLFISCMIMYLLLYIISCYAIHSRITIPTQSTSTHIRQYCAQHRGIFEAKDSVRVSWMHFLLHIKLDLVSAARCYHSTASVTGRLLGSTFYQTAAMTNP
jgi:hypothetical protein